jgi:hypothetical protein
VADDYAVPGGAHATGGQPISGRRRRDRARRRFAFRANAQIRSGSTQKAVAGLPLGDFPFSVAADSADVWSQNIPFDGSVGAS